MAVMIGRWFFSSQANSANPILFTNACAPPQTWDNLAPGEGYPVPANGACAAAPLTREALADAVAQLRRMRDTQRRERGPYDPHRDAALAVTGGDMGSPFGRGTIGGIPLRATFADMLDPRFREIESMGPSPPDLPVSDHGLVGAIPLPEPSWNPWMPLPDAEWSQQNRKINDLLAGRTRA